MSLLTEKLLQLKRPYLAKSYRDDNSNGAAVMVGHQSGVGTEMKDRVPHIVATHCVAHHMHPTLLLT